MSEAVQVLKEIYAVFALLPFLTFAIIWIIAYGITSSKQVSTRASMDITCFFLMGSVYVLTRETMGGSFLYWAVILLLLILIGFVGREQNLRHGQIRTRKIFILASRTGFLTFSLLYVVFMFIRVAQFLS